MVSQLTSLNFLNCLFFDKILLTFSYFSPKIFFSLFWPQTACSLNIFAHFPARLASYRYVMTALAVVSGHLPSRFCSSTFFPSFSPATFSRLWIYHTLFFSWSSFTIHFSLSVWFVPCASRSDMQLPCLSGMPDPECTRTSSGHFLSRVVHRHDPRCCHLCILMNSSRKCIIKLCVCMRYES